MDTFEFLFKLVDAFAILIAAFIFTKRNTRAQTSISIQAEAMSKIADALSRNKIIVPKLNSEISNIKAQIDAEEERVKKGTANNPMDPVPGIPTLDSLKTTLVNKQKELNTLTTNILDILAQWLYTLQITGSPKTKKWITDKLSSSLNGITPWLTDKNIEELIWLMRVELGVASISERVKHIIRSWLF